MNEKELAAELLRVESVVRHRLKNMKNNPKREGNKELIAYENGMWFVYDLLKPIVNKLIKSRANEEAKYQPKQTEYGQPYNIYCFHYQELDGEISCGVRMDMCFCGKNCAFATNNQQINRTRR